MKIPKTEDVVLDCLAILSLIFLLSGMLRVVSNQSYGLLLLLIGVALFIVFTCVVANLRKKRQTVTGSLHELRKSNHKTASKKVQPFDFLARLC